MATVDVDDSSQFSADSQPKSTGLVWGLAATRRLVYIHQMNRVNSRNDFGRDDSTINIVMAIIRDGVNVRRRSRVPCAVWTAAECRGWPSCPSRRDDRTRGSWRLARPSDRSQAALTASSPTAAHAPVPNSPAGRHFYLLISFKHQRQRAQATAYMPVKSSTMNIHGAYMLDKK